MSAIQRCLPAIPPDALAGDHSQLSIGQVGLEDGAMSAFSRGSFAAPETEKA